MSMDHKAALTRIVQDGLLGPGFQFRDGQVDVILKILDAWESGKSGFILEAPTGSGKSIIAMAVGLLLEFHGKRGYVLASDLSLQDQYEVDLGIRIPGWGSVRGVDNYGCHVNGEVYSLGDCKVRGLGASAQSALSCYESCEYIMRRNFAADSGVALLNYSYWLVQRNYVARVGKELFGIRDFTIFDEAHKIPGLVQSHFSPRVGEAELDRIRILDEAVVESGIGIGRPGVARIGSLIRGFRGRRVQVDDILSGLVDLELELRRVVGMSEELDRRVAAGEVPVGVRLLGVRRGLDFVKDLHCKVQDYVGIIGNIGDWSLVMDVSEESVSFYCLDERWLVRRYLTDQSGFKLFMSATVGGFKEFATAVGLEDGDWVGYRMGSTFGFEESPIYYSGGPRLNWKNKDVVLPGFVQVLDRILDRHAGRGVIHTGSYENSRRIFQMSRHRGRLLSYDGSAGKAEVLERHGRTTGGVLIGPSLSEGIDLPGDLCEFQVIFKVPYASLGSELIKRKLDHYGYSWYKEDALRHILQAIGRGIRYPGDVSVTYILDGAFRDLLDLKDHLPGYVLDRLVQVDVTG